MEEKKKNKTQFFSLLLGLEKEEARDCTWKHVEYINT